MGPVTCYLDTSILVALLTPEPSSGRAESFLQRNDQLLLISDFAAAEFASAVSRRVRVGDYTLDQGRTVLLSFDAWVKRAANQVETQPLDIALATTCLRRLDLNLRTPDALHVAIARRLDATLATFDRQMAAAARALGIAVAMP